MTVPPRIYAMVANRAPVAVVFWHGAGGWWHLGRWDLTSGDYEPGAWFRGRLYPRRCDLSPDGQLLYLFATKALKPDFLRGSGFGAYHAVSRVPWLFALAAWYEGSTWTRGFHFMEGPEASRPWDIGEAEEGDAGPLRARYGLAVTPVVQYAAERRRGWIEHEQCPPRVDAWDEQRSAVLSKASPAGGCRLVMADRGLDLRAPGIEGRRPVYAIEAGGRRWSLEAAWADWDHQGRLLVATPDARLQLRNPEAPEGVLREHDLSSLRPDPQPAPGWARRW
jgi:hypothetical protein